MSAVSTSRPKQRNDPLNKKIQPNPKYKNVGPSIDTGASMSKHMKRIEDIKEHYKFRQDEIFKRMKPTTFVQLAVRVYELTTEEEQFDELQSSGTADELCENGGGENGSSPVPSLALTAGDYGDNNDEYSTARSTLLRTPYAQSVAHGVGELDLNGPAEPPSNNFVDDICPYLLLDVRDPDAFDQCHILTARNYPKATLARATNFESKEMLSYRNSEGKIIVVYDEDERLAPFVATTLVQRGYDNLFVLSGGMKKLYKLFPEGLIVGTPPPSVSGCKPKHIVPCFQNTFTAEDMNKVEMYLSNALQDQSIGSSSRLSQASTARSRMSKASARSSTSQSSSAYADKPPFKC